MPTSGILKLSSTLVSAPYEQLMLREKMIARL
jgi:hypothetical protein